MKRGLAVLVPTYVSRCDLTQQQEFVSHVLERLAETQQAHPQLPLSLWVGMQWATGQRDESLRRLRHLGGLAGAQPWLGYVGLSLPGPGKLHTTNAAIRLATALDPAGWVWLDDDILMEPGCLRELAARFLARGGRGAVGAAKVPHAKAYQASKLMCQLGRLTAPHRSYPHACCMVVAADVVAGGVPTWLGSDDGYVLFELLDPAREDPWADLELMPSARCRYYQGSRAGETLQRLHRALYSHLLHVASYPWPVGRAYLSETLFYGLWPVAPWDGRRSTRYGLARWVVKAVHAGWFTAVAASLALRGAVNRPRCPPAVAPYAEHWSALRLVEEESP